MGVFGGGDAMYNGCENVLYSDHTIDSTHLPHILDYDHIPRFKAKVFGRDMSDV